MNLREEIKTGRGIIRARRLARLASIEQLQEIAAQALMLHDNLWMNCGMTADWPLDLIARDEAASEDLAESLTALKKALEGEGAP